MKCPLIILIPVAYSYNQILPRQLLEGDVNVKIIVFLYYLDGRKNISNNLRTLQCVAWVVETYRCSGYQSDYLHQISNENKAINN